MRNNFDNPNAIQPVIPEGYDRDKFLRGVGWAVQSGDMSEVDALFLLYPTWAAANINVLYMRGPHSNYSDRRN